MRMRQHTGGGSTPAAHWPCALYSVLLLHTAAGMSTQGDAVGWWGGLAQQPGACLNA